jgi:hypothetical protein
MSKLVMAGMAASLFAVRSTLLEEALAEVMVAMVVAFIFLQQCI